ncbi:MAG: succinyl-CoA--3-ketoacid-CoA transferase, partial [Candidatus Competibacteraceae bacterium]|nr:succinyl-CoA--3-ketoacid-CoA transferase [Candidatus Competibacteraceae bacterium]
LIITMTHTDRDGNSKVVPRCSLPLTARGAVDVLITELAKFRFVDGNMLLVKVMPGATLEQVQESTDAAYKVALETR